MNHGTRVSGWQFDWGKAQKDVDACLKSGRVWMAAACADPGCCQCPQCGEGYWSEFEVFLCIRCGAEVTIGEHGKTTATPPRYPEKCRPKLFDGMRVRYIGQAGTSLDNRPKRFDGLWPAGRVTPGEVGTVRVCVDDGISMLMSRVDFDGRVPAKDANGESYVWGVFGPFLDDTFEILSEVASGTTATPTV